MNVRFRIALILVVSLFGGCGELTVYDTPMAQGIVRDRVTGEPIENAIITLNGEHEKVTTSNKLGKFVLSPVTHKETALLPWDTVAPKGSISINATGYRAQRIALQPGLNDIVVELVPDK